MTLTLWSACTAGTWADNEYRAWGVSPGPWPQKTALLVEETQAEPTPARWTRDDVLVASSQARHSAAIACIFRYEVGGVGYDPYAIHMDSRVYGPGGLAAFGLLPEFNRRGFTDPYSPYEVAAYLDQVADEGRLAGNYPEVRDGRCPSF